MKFINLIVASIFFLIYLSVNVPPTQKYNLWILTFAIPILLAVNTFLFLFYLVLRRISAILYFIPLIFSVHFIFTTYGVKRFLTRDACAADSSFTVLSYNVSGLKLQRGRNSFTYDAKQDKDSATYKLKQWIIQNPADIQCYQEFFDNEENSYFDVVNTIKKKGYFCVFSSDAPKPDLPGVGVFIASRFPIVKHGVILVGENGYNRTVFADIKIGNDTVRIVNLHLESMEMKKYNPIYVDDTEDKKQRLKVVLRKLRSGVFERSKQLKQILAAIDTSSHPVICAGDLNELPYSYAYHLLKKNMKNGFEERGEGFGFSYNGKTLRALRIDNQFFSDGIGIQEFKTLQDIPYSDHFPLLGTYGVCNSSE